MPGRHRKPPTPVLPVATGAFGVTAVLLGAASASPPPVAAPAAVAVAAFTADAPTEWWRTDAPRRAVTKPAPIERQAAPATGAPTAVSQPTSAPLAPKKPTVAQAAPERPTGAQEAATKAPAATVGGTVSCAGSWLSGVKQVAKTGGCDVRNRFDVSTIYGYATRSKEHASGKALDFMTYGDVAKGNAIAEYLLANREALGVQHVIWRQRINFGSGWRPMADEGSDTANHFDHPHALFK